MHRRIVVLAVLAGLLAASLPAQAHSIGEPLPVEQHVLQDEGRDEFYWYDGYDLWTLFVREAYRMETGESGLVFRFTLYGGFSPSNVSDQLHIDLGMDADGTAHEFRLSTPNDFTWEGDLPILRKNVTRNEAPWTGVTTEMEVFVPHDELGVASGDAVSGFRMASYADQDIRDRAPGGFYVPNSQGMAEVPSRNDQVGETAYLDSRRLVENLTLQGPVGYLDTTTAVDGWNLTLTVSNPFEDQGQHAVIRPRAAEGWQVRTDGRLVAVLEGGASATFAMEARPTGNASAPLPVEIVTDIGGREVLHVGAANGTLQVARDAEALPVEPAASGATATPGPAAWMAVAAAAVALVLIRRR